MIQTESSWPIEMRIREAVPYRLQPTPSADRRKLVFSERITHRLAVYVVAGIVVALMIASLVAFLAGMPLQSVQIVQFVGGPLVIIVLVKLALSLRPHALLVDPKGGACVKTDHKGRVLATFEAEDAGLRIVQLTGHIKPKPWGYAVVLAAPEIQFTLAAVRDAAQAEQYVDGLPAVLKERLSTEITPAVVPWLTPRVWGK